MAANLLTNCGLKLSSKKKSKENSGLDKIISPMTMCVQAWAKKFRFRWTNVNENLAGLSISRHLARARLTHHQSIQCAPKWAAVIAAGHCCCCCFCCCCLSCAGQRTHPMRTQGAKWAIQDNGFVPGFWIFNLRQPAKLAHSFVAFFPLARLLARSPAPGAVLLAPTLYNTWSNAHDSPIPSCVSRIKTRSNDSLSYDNNQLRL